MSAVSKELLTVLGNLQKLPSLSGCLLGGGTNLAIRYNHRKSLDIDLFFPEIIGRQHYDKICEEVKSNYGEKVFGMDYPCEIDDQYIFLRFFVQSGDEIIKVEIMQNMHTHDQAEIIEGNRMMSESDIGLLKLMSSSNRANHKDIYDLDYITDKIPLNQLMTRLKEKEEKYNQSIDRNIFDQDGEKSPTEDPQLLLKFDNPQPYKSNRPSHSETRIDLTENGRSWMIARSQWRRKVRAYFSEIGKEFPGIKPVNQ